MDVKHIIRYLNGGSARESALWAEYLHIKPTLEWVSNQNSNVVATEPSRLGFTVQSLTLGLAGIAAALSGCDKPQYVAEKPAIVQEIVQKSPLEMAIENAKSAKTASAWYDVRVIAKGANDYSTQVRADLNILLNLFDANKNPDTYKEIISVAKEGIQIISQDKDKVSAKEQRYLGNFYLAIGQARAKIDTGSNKAFEMYTNYMLAMIHGDDEVKNAAIGDLLDGIGAHQKSVKYFQVAFRSKLLTDAERVTIADLLYQSSHGMAAKDIEQSRTAALRQYGLAPKP